MVSNAQKMISSAQAKLSLPVSTIMNRRQFIFESLLLNDLKLYGEVIPEFKMEGFSRSWVIDFYLKNYHTCMEVSARNVFFCGKTKKPSGGCDKFLATMFKFIDLKTKDPNLKTIMVWCDYIPTTSSNLSACSKWGIYVLSFKDRDLFRSCLNKIFHGASAEDINIQMSNFLAYNSKHKLVNEKITNSIIEIIRRQPATLSELKSQIQNLGLPTENLEALLRSRLKKHGIIHLCGIKENKLYCFPSQIKEMSSTAIMNILIKYGCNYEADLLITELERRGFQIEKIFKAIGEKTCQIPP